MVTGGVVVVEEVVGGVTVEVAGGVVGVIVGVTTTSEPRGANGFGLPSVPLLISSILESCKVLKAESEKIASSSFIVFTFRRTVRNSLPEIPEEVLVPLVLAVFASGEVPDAGTKAGCSGAGFKKKK